MLERLKALGDAAKSFLLWVVTPLILLISLISYLVMKNRSLQLKADELQSNNKVIKEKEVMHEKDITAATSLDEYRKLRDSYFGSGSDSDKT